MKTRHAQYLFAFVLGVVIAVSFARAQPAHLTLAQQFVNDIDAGQLSGPLTYKNAANQDVAYNRYGGSWSGADAYIVKLATATTRAENYTVCAPLVSILLQRAYPGWSWSSVTFTDTLKPLLPVNKQSVTTASPFPYQYVKLMQQQKGFPDGPVATLDAVRPGYIFALWQPALANQTNDHAGLVVAVRLDDAVDYPSGAATANATYAGTRLVPVDIIDSSKNPHGPDDSRIFTLTHTVVNPDGTTAVTSTTYTTQGVGAGTMGVLIDAAGTVLGHIWSLPAGNPASANATEVANWLTTFHANLRLQSDRELLFARHEKQAVTP